MQEYETVREVLEDLIEFNEADTESLIKDDVQEINLERLCNLCDLLGMSDIYLKS